MKQKHRTGKDLIALLPLALERAFQTQTPTGARQAQASVERPGLASLVFSTAPGTLGFGSICLSKQLLWEVAGPVWLNLLIFRRDAKNRYLYVKSPS